jgi:hypothetical protein
LTLSATLLRSMRLRIEGAAIDMRMAAMAIVTNISINVKPACPNLGPNVSGVRKQNSRFMSSIRAKSKFRNDVQMNLSTNGLN